MLCLNSLQCMLNDLLNLCLFLIGSFIAKKMSKIVQNALLRLKVGMQTPYLIPKLKYLSYLYLTFSRAHLYHGLRCLSRLK